MRQQASFHKNWQNIKVPGSTSKPARLPQSRRPSADVLRFLRLHILDRHHRWCTANKTAPLPKQTDVVACTCARCAATQRPVLHAKSDVSERVTLSQGEFHLCTGLDILTVEKTETRCKAGCCCCACMHLPQPSTPKVMAK